MIRFPRLLVFPRFFLVPIIYSAFSLFHLIRVMLTTVSYTRTNAATISDAPRMVTILSLTQRELRTGVSRWAAVSPGVSASWATASTGEYPWS